MRRISYYYDGTPITFDLAHGNQISVSDPDVGSGVMWAKIIAVNGVVTLHGTAGITMY